MGFVFEKNVWTKDLVWIFLLDNKKPSHEIAEKSANLIGNQCEVIFDYLTMWDNHDYSN